MPPDFPWRFLALLSLIRVAVYVGSVATPGFLLTSRALRPIDKTDNEQSHPRSAALGPYNLGRSPTAP